MAQQTKQHIWEDVIDDEIRAIASNYAARMGLGSRPALLCIDNYNAVFGDRREPVLEAMKRFPSSCGERAWDAVEPTLKVLQKTRELGLPIFHTTRDRHNILPNPIDSTKRMTKGSDKTWNAEFFAPLAPQEGEYVIEKTRASAFYGTPLDPCLIRLGIDTLILVGNSTSGCVRATCLEAFMRGYKVALVEECVFDRNWLSHKINLFDMNSKYGDVMFVDEILDYLQSVRS